tara:strand:- start:2650 stop:6939 length:4290 start_codon:yes stop_codon:yes gene_type:complete
MVKIVGDQFFGKQNIRKKDSNLKDDDIKSIQFAKVVDLLCHGEIEGIKEGNSAQLVSYQENIFLDDTQIQTTNGRQNFSGVSVDVRTGESSQEPLGIIDAIENTTPVSRLVARDPLNTAKQGEMFVNDRSSSFNSLNPDINNDSGYRLENNSVSLPPHTIIFLYINQTHLFKVNEFVNLVLIFDGNERESSKRIAKVKKIGTATKNNVSYKYIFLDNKSLIRKDGKTDSFSNTTNVDVQLANVATSVGVTATTSSINQSTIDFDKLRVSIQFPDLGKSNDKGESSSFATSFQLQIIEAGVNGKTHFPIVNEEVKGIAVRGYTRDFEIDLKNFKTQGFFLPADSSQDRFFKINVGINNINNYQVGDNITFKFIDLTTSRNELTRFRPLVINKTFENVQITAIDDENITTNLKTTTEGVSLQDHQVYSFTKPSPSTYVVDENDPNKFIIQIKNILTNFPLQIKVIRNIFDETDIKKRNKINFLSFTEIKTETRPYNNFALAGLRFNAEQFGRYPSRKYLVQGTKIKIPAPDSDGRTPVVVRSQDQADNLNLGTLKNFNFIHYPDNYVFNGTLTTTKFFTNDPSWVLFDLLTTSKGFGEHIKESQLDVFNFYETSKYNSELLTLSDGTKEPRFACNVILGQKKDAYQVIRDFCSNMNAVPFYSVGSLKISQDKPTDVSYVFGLANVTEFGFLYNTTSQKTKFTQCTVSYFDNEVQDLQIANVFLKDLHPNLSNVESAFGINIKNLKTFGCTSRTQAIRAAKWFLLTQFTRGETVSFSVTVEAGVIVRPGQVIAIQDPLKMNERTGGRVVSATTINDNDNDTTVITVDDVEKTNLSSIGTTSRQLTIVLDTDENETDPNKSSRYVETKPVLSVDLAQKTITTTAFRKNPLPNTFYVVDRQVNNVSSLPKYRVVSIAESKNDGSYSVTAVSYNDLIYSLVESVDPITVEPIKTVIDLPNPPTNLDAVENIILQDNRATSVITVSWTPVRGVKEYFLEYKVDGVIKRITTSEINFDIFNSTKGNYEFAIKSLNAFGQQSNTSTQIQGEFLGKLKAPSNVSNLFVEAVSDELIKIKFDKSTELDVLHGGSVAYCYDSNTDGSGSFFLDENGLFFPGNSSEIIVQNLAGEHMLKFIDDGGRASLQATSVVINSTPASNAQYNDIKKQTTAIVQNIAEHATNPKFQGFPGIILFNTEFDSLLDALTLTSTGVTSGEAAYLFKEILDLKEVTTVQLEKIISAEGISNVNWDDYVGDVDTFRSWDQLSSDETFDISVKLKVQSTNNAPANSSSYVISDFSGCPFVEVTNSTFTGRGFRFVLELFCRNLNQNIKVKQLGCNVKINRRTETSIETLTTSSTQDTVVTFAKPFFAGDASLDIGADLKPYVEVIVLNLEDEEYLSITDITNTDFKINIFKRIGLSSATDERRARDFNFVAIGYG